MSYAGNDPSAAIDFDVVVVGAGQAGLAAGYFLRRAGVSFQLFERANRIGDSWRHRYESLALFSPRAYSSLPGLSMDGDPEGYPGKDEVAAYLERYAEAFSLPRSMGEGVALLERRAERFVVRTSGARQITSRAVVVASGPFQHSVIPPFASHLPADVMQVSADSYRHPRQIRARRVLVVGGGATGRQIALELSRSHDVFLSVGRRVAITPQRVFGRDVMAWFDRLGMLRADKATPLGRFVRAHESFPGLHLRSRALTRRGVKLRPRTVGAKSGKCVFADGSAEWFDAVIWAIGYRDDSSWLHISEAVDDARAYLEDRGVSAVPGLFHVGRSWQTSRASALLCGVGADAAQVIARVAKAIHPPQVRAGSPSPGRAAEPSEIRSQW